MLAALVLALGAPARPARACGGNFCSAMMPVVQRGEEIVYVVGADGSMTMTVRIAYTGAAPDFAWILPVPETPEITLGTDALFTVLDPATRPAFSVTSRTEGTCRTPPRCEYPPAPDAGRWPAYDAATVFSDASGPDGGGPIIYAEDSVGPYETVVLGGGTAAEIRDWLATRGYDIPAASLPLLDDYVAAGQRFVALRLRNDATSGEIQPITLAFGGVAPCLPIRLTAIATAPTLPITAYFLADARATPRNYSLVETPFPVSVYFGGRFGYDAWLDAEVDALGGRAFITDFAGAVPAGLSVPALASAADLATETDFAVFFEALSARGYLADTALAGLLGRFVTPPDGVSASSYASCLVRPFSGGPAVCGVPLGFDAAGLSAAIEASITAPRVAAAGWLADRPYLTRLYTTMTAAEMTLDPEFVIDAGLDDVGNVHAAELVTECDARTFSWDARVRLDTDDGRSLEVSPGRTSQTDAEYCRSVGGWLAGMAPDAGPMDAGPRSPGGGGSAGCAVGARGSSAGAALVALALVALALVVVRVRRGRRGPR